MEGTRGNRTRDEVGAVGRSHLGEVSKVPGEDFGFYSDCSPGRVSHGKMDMTRFILLKGHSAWWRMDFGGRGRGGDTDRWL